jgi:hypothetical protein
MALAKSVFVRGRQRYYREINIGPPAKITGEIRQNFVSIFGPAFDPPVSQKDIIVCLHSAGRS